MAVNASGNAYPWNGSKSFSVHVAYREHMQHHNFDLSPAMSRAYLENLVREFFRITPMVWLPYETVFGQSALLKYVKQAEVSDVDCQDFAQSMQLAMQEALDPVTQLYGAVVPSAILHLARQRFRAFLPSH
jgi:hypothetical protein